MARVIGYGRVSTEQQADNGVSMDVQRRKIEGYADIHDLELVDVVEDRGWSGKSLDRPGLQRIMAALEGGEADGVLVLKLDRLSRSVKDLGLLIDRYFSEEAGKNLWSVQDSIDTRTAGGRLVLNVLMSVAQWEREAIAERTRAALRHMKEQGIKTGGDVPFGFRSRKVKGKKVLAESIPEQKVLLKIQELRASGLSLNAIAEQLNRSKKEKNRCRGKKWYPMTVSRIVKAAKGADAEAFV